MSIKVHSFTVQAKMKSESDTEKKVSSSAGGACGGDDDAAASGGERSHEEIIDDCVNIILERLNKEFNGRLF